MALSVATWNINSVRLRMPLIEHLLKTWQPDILCLQETKCPNDQFPSKPLKALGYNHIEMHGQKGYHGVATISRLPLHELSDRRDSCGVQQSIETFRNYLALHSAGASRGATLRSIANVMH